MNEVLNTIRTRYSCRSFDGAPIPPELLETVLEAGKYAPNGKNSQAWHFTVISSPEGRELAIKALGKNPPPNFPKDMIWPHDADFHGAPTLILISCDPNVPYPDVGCHIAAGYMMLAATSLGLATVWSTAFTKDSFRDEESCSVRSKLIPEGYEMYAALFIGYAKNPPAPRPERKSGVVTYL